MSHDSLDELLEVAVGAAYAAGRRTLAYFNAGVEVETKSDNTPVTRADREAEDLIRAHIARHFPDHSILGEERGESRGSPDFRWIIDPIDGTKSFIHGVPLYGVLIGIEVKREPAVGVIYMPALDEMVCAARGRGCRWNGRAARVSAVSRIEDATCLTSSFTSCMSRPGGFAKLSKMVKLTRGWGDCYGYALLATGRADIMIDPQMHPWDCAAVMPVVIEAGGKFTTWDNQPTIHGPDAVGTNGLLHDSVIGLLK